MVINALEKINPGRKKSAKVGSRVAVLNTMA